jgi:hypothetical protein
MYVTVLTPQLKEEYAHDPAARARETLEAQTKAFAAELKKLRGGRTIMMARSAFSTLSSSAICATEMPDGWRSGGSSCRDGPLGRVVEEAVEFGEERCGVGANLKPGLNFLCVVLGGGDRKSRQELISDKLVPTVQRPCVSARGGGAELRLVDGDFHHVARCPRRTGCATSSAHVWTVRGAPSRRWCKPPIVRDLACRRRDGYASYNQTRRRSRSS